MIDDQNSTMQITADDALYKAIEDFVVDNNDLEKLEDLLGETNFFEAIGAERAELRHSAFLGYLLDPLQTHGLGEIFLKRFLQEATRTSSGDKTPISAIDIDVMDLRDTIVQRESENIDILLLSRSNKFGVVIENKVDSSEHSNQLTRYREAVSRDYPDYTFLFIFLTVEGDLPTDDTYQPISYRAVSQIIHNILTYRERSLSSDVQMILHHYVDLIRRKFMQESQLTTLAKKIYEQHRLALDFIFEQRPDSQTDRQRLLESLIARSEELSLAHSTKSYIRFSVDAWEPWNSAVGDGYPSWGASKQVLLFEFRNLADRLQLALVLGPADAALRQMIFDLTGEHKKHFPQRITPLGAKTSQVWAKSILSKNDISNSDGLELDEIIEKKWESFLVVDLPLLCDFVIENVIQAKDI